MCDAIGYSFVVCFGFCDYVVWFVCVCVFWCSCFQSLLILRFGCWRIVLRDVLIVVFDLLFWFMLVAIAALCFVVLV